MPLQAGLEQSLGSGAYGDGHVNKWTPTMDMSIGFCGTCFRDSDAARKDTFLKDSWSVASKCNSPGEPNGDITVLQCGPEGIEGEAGGIGKLPIRDTDTGETVAKDCKAFSGVRKSAKKSRKTAVLVLRLGNEI